MKVDVVKGKGVPRTDHTSALNEFGKKSLEGSVGVISDHIKMMIPLTTSLITAYFALLQFLGVKTAIDSTSISGSTVIGPPIIMLGSLIAFIITSFPVLKQITVGNVDSIISYRNFMIVWKYVGAGLGMSLFLYSIFMMIYVLTLIIQSR